MHPDAAAELGWAPPVYYQLATKPMGQAGGWCQGSLGGGIHLPCHVGNDDPCYVTCSCLAAIAAMSTL